MSIPTFACIFDGDDEQSIQYRKELDKQCAYCCKNKYLIHCEEQPNVKKIGIIHAPKPFLYEDEEITMCKTHGEKIDTILRIRWDRKPRLKMYEGRFGTFCFRVWDWMKIVTCASCADSLLAGDQYVRGRVWSSAARRLNLPMGCLAPSFEYHVVGKLEEFYHYSDEELAMAIISNIFIKHKITLFKNHWKYWWYDCLDENGMTRFCKYTYKLFCKL